MASAPTHSRPCEFWLGRAGSGKTHGCLAAIAEHLKASPRGEPLILLAPEQASAQLERRLATWPGVLGGFTRARVFSFNHLVREAFARAGGAPPRPVDETGRVMILRRLLDRRGGSLRAFRSCARQPGVAESLGEAILEFQRYGWQVDDLERWVQSATESERENDLLARKLSDLALLWREYERALARAGWDDLPRVHEAAADAIRGWPDLEGVRVWIDGFATFTVQEFKLLDALLEPAASVVIALCVDPTDILRNMTAGERARPLKRIGSERLFENIEQTFFQLRDRLAEAAWSIQVKALPDAGQPARFAPASPLAYLESRVIGRYRIEPCPDRDWESAAGAIELIEAADRRVEIEAAARRIVALCRRESSPEAHPTQPRPAMTWRDVAVIARDLAPYEPFIREVFGQFEIPYFLDRPRQTEGHPLARLILSALAVLRRGWAGGVVLDHLKSGLAGLSEADAMAALENHIRAVDPEGSTWLRQLETGGGALWEAWRKAAVPLERFEAALRRGDNPARALWGFLEAVGAPTALETWVAREREQGREEAALLHEQAWEQVVGWLEQLDCVVSQMPDLFAPGEATAEDRGQAQPSPSPSFLDRLDGLMDMIQSALAATRSRLIPPTLNQVTVGAVDRSRTPDVQVAFVLGMNEREFPRLWLPDPILGDAERERLTDGRRRLGPDTIRKRLQEHFLAYIALTRSSERLVVSRPLIDDENGATDPSPYFTQLARAFPRAAMRSVGHGGEGDDPALPIRPEEWTLRLGSGFALLRETGRAAPLAGLMGSGHPFDHPALAAEQRARLEKAQAAMSPSAPARLDPALAREFWRGRTHLHVTALERYGECPFKFYAGIMLGLAERKAAALDARDLGTARHDMLNTLFRKLRAPEGLWWGEVDVERTDGMIDEWVQAAFKDPRWQGRLEGSALGRAVIAGCGRDLKLFIRALRLAGERYGFRQIESEWKFGDAGELTLEAGGLSFSIHGTIDRIDALMAERPGEAPAGGRTLIVIDYKSGQRKIDEARLLAGIDLQLPLYGLALARRTDPAREGGAPRIGGLFYWPLSAPLSDAQPDEAPDAPAVDERWFENRSPSGLFEQDLISALDCRVQPGDASPAFRFKLNKDGTLDKRRPGAVPSGVVTRLMNFAFDLVSKKAERIVAGEIAARPFRVGKEQACDRCAFGAVCRLAERDAVQPRFIARADKQGFLDALDRAGARGGTR